MAMPTVKQLATKTTRHPMDARKLGSFRGSNRFDVTSTSWLLLRFLLRVRLLNDPQELARSALLGELSQSLCLVRVNWATEAILQQLGQSDP
jgi:hypothetical protein